MPKVSMIVPVYNVEPYIHRCIESILMQTYKDFELILVDDASPDLCPKICEEYAASDSRIHVLQHHENGGLSKARNTGIEWAFSNSNSQWLTFIDSDDWVHPLYLEALIEAVQANDIAVVTRFGTHGDNFPQICNVTIKDISTEEFYLQHMENAVPAWGKLYRKELFTNVRYPEGKLFEDEFVTYKLLFLQKTIPLVLEPLYANYINPNGIYRSNWSPAHLSVLVAMEEQISYFVSTGHMQIAKRRISDLIWQNRHQQNSIRNSSSLSTTEKKDLTNQLKEQLKRLLKQYCKYHFIKFWEGGESLWIYSNLYPVIGIPHKIYRIIKATLKNEQRFHAGR